jgi:hypothetical protein
MARHDVGPVRNIEEGGKEEGARRHEERMVKGIDLQSKRQF